MEKRNQFLNETKKFFEAGVLTELYNNENFSICNVANQCYGAFYYLKSNENQCGLLINAHQVEQFVNDPNFYTHFFQHLPDVEWSKRAIILDDRTFKKMIELKKKNDVKPSHEINLQLEEELMSKKKSR